jgi:hypothetical protein
MFEFNTSSPNEFKGECQKLAQPYRILRCGERFSVGPALPDTERTT